MLARCTQQGQTRAICRCITGVGVAAGVGDAAGVGGADGLGAGSGKAYIFIKIMEKSFPVRWWGVPRGTTIRSPLVI